LVDDDQNLLKMMIHHLTNDGYKVETAANGEEGVEAFKRFQPDLVILDMQMPVMDGMGALKAIKEISPEQIVMIFSAFDDLETAIALMQAGAYDYLQKPFEVSRLKQSILNALRHKYLLAEIKNLREEINQKYQFSNIIGSSGVMQDVFTAVNKIVNTNVTVLLMGESGTGKELIARAIHEHTENRKQNPYVAVNCAALPEHLLESELFGHEKGAFTGASEKRTGKFEYANGGTLFLDEIGEMPLSMQAKLIRVLQEREFSRLGSNKTIPTDIRIISATNKDLEAMVKKGTFREDLYYRLAVFPIRMPPLRERREDIALLTKYFLEKYSQSMGLEKIPSISQDAHNLLHNYGWPGNVRELENTIQRAMVESIGGDINAAHLTPSIFNVHTDSTTTRDEFELTGKTLPQMVAELEKTAIEYALKRFKNNISEVSKYLDVGRTTLYRKMEQFGLSQE
jgi:DNA-binding NtrC family response regulator